MTQSELDKLIEEEAKEHWGGFNDVAWYNCLVDSFKDGAHFGIYLERERSAKLVEALKWYTTCKVTDSVSATEYLQGCAKQALEELDEFLEGK
jgi:hypothetical protein